VAPALTLADISAEVDTQFPADFCRQRHVLALKDGTLLATQPEYVNQFRRAMTERGYQNIMIRPALYEVFEAKLTDLNKAKRSTGDVRHSSEIQDKIQAYIARAIQEESSDIHIIARQGGTAILFTVHGESRTIDTLPASAAIEIANVLFNYTADGKSGVMYNPNKPMDGSMEVHVGNRFVRVRMASLHTHPVGNVHLVLRLLTSANNKPAVLHELGYEPVQLRVLRGALARPYGMILVNGPTGSGKTTTLSSMMQELPTNEISYSIEEPIEYTLPNVTQIPANNEDPDSDISYGSILKRILRAAPRNIMLGEIRDQTSAHYAVQIANTGHRLLSSIHADSNRSVITRLADLGISHLSLSDPDLLVALVHQRLLPRLCPHCSIPFEPNIELFEKNNLALVMRLQKALDNDTKNVRFRRGVNNPCKICTGKGVLGRTVVAEVVYVDDDGRAMIRDGKLAEWGAYLLDSGLMTLRAHVLTKIAAGIVCPRDAERSCLGSLTDGIIGRFDYSSALGMLGTTDGRSR
jgi:type II secretory ATPase GspE/PulE/Tfp pilus assembly ATPase PilB-like protein